nr:DUF305 domain-containing protein [uncultured Brevundimonas sp.]
MFPTSLARAPATFPPPRLGSKITRNALTLVTLGVPSIAYAHVKWFEAYEVSAKPVSIQTTLSLPFFWVGIALVLGFFLVTSFFEAKRPGQVVMGGLDKATSLISKNADGFLVGVLCAFFLALFAMGGTFLTPELKTDAAWVPWMQLVIAMLIVARRTRPIAAAMIVLLWVLTIGSYDLFHLFDYLALGLGIAGYLLLSGLPDGKWHDRRFAVLRWGIALALTWSSMEKFMYPQWFLPLLEEKPFLAFGMPFGPYTTMAGVAEFTLGFGLLWSPLIRRLSAVALFALMFAAVYPFGRVDLIGHATILAALLVVIADPLCDQALEIAPRRRRALFVPAGLAIALAVTMGSYAGLHHLIYESSNEHVATLLRAESSRHPETGAAPGAFWRGQTHYHGEAGATRAPGAGAAAAMMAQMQHMHDATNAVQVTGDLDHDFTALMIPHHQAAVDMANTYLESGNDPELRQLAQHIVQTQQHEISQMQAHARPSSQAQSNHAH